MHLWRFSDAGHVEGKRPPGVVVSDGVAMLNMETLELDLMDQARHTHLDCGCLHHPVVNVHGDDVHSPEGLLPLLVVDVMEQAENQ